MTTPPQPSGPALEIPDGLETVYSNLARIAHSPADLVIDFGQILPGETRARIKVRVMMSPLAAKLLLRALTENLARYESTFGQINLPGNPTLADHLFKPYNPPDDKPG
jgi:hypothetical protein